MNSLKYISIENRIFTENRFILSKQFNEKISGHIEYDPNIKLSPEELLFLRVESRDNKIHKDVINLIKNNRTVKS